MQNSTKYLALIALLFVLALVIVLRKKMLVKHPDDSVKCLMGKKVYSESGCYIGDVSEVVLGKNKIESLKIRIDKKYKLKTDGVIINYKYVKGVGHVVFLDEKVSDCLENLAESTQE